MQGWQRFGLRVITGLFWLVVDLFRAIVEAAERMMYAVDEWLRFKSGESGLTLAAKAVFGLLWSVVAYVLRFAINVLIEPQFNPIKHFPVVTVSHKLLLPLIPHFAKGPHRGGNGESGGGTYRRRHHHQHSRTLRIPGLGADGELAAVCRQPAAEPGARADGCARRIDEPPPQIGLPLGHAAKAIRQAPPCRAPRAGRSWYAVHKQIRALRRIELSIRHYVEREFLELFAESRCWQGPALLLEEVRLGTNSVRLAIGCPDLGAADLHLAMDLQSGWLVAGVARAGWLERLLPHQRQVLTTALLGLYKTAGADLVRNRLRTSSHRPRRGTTFPARA